MELLFLSSVVVSVACAVVTLFMGAFVSAFDYDKAALRNSLLVVSVFYIVSSLLAIFCVIENLIG